MQPPSPASSRPEPEAGHPTGEPGAGHGETSPGHGELSPGQGELSAGPRIYSVGHLTRAIRERLEELGRLSVEGEVSGLRRPSSGHLYFQLKDTDAVLSCAIWRSRVDSALGRTGGSIDEGMKIVAHGRLDVYGPRGGYSLIVDRIEERGLGARLADLERSKAELRARGWFERARPLPELPARIGVVTSRDGAAFQDFLRTRSLRWPMYPVRLVHAPVQGPGAARALAEALARLDASGVDVIILCRGGGSLEDLWAFNELPLAEAIWQSSVPVVSGVGHESDWTLADLVSDHRAHTPTDAAQTVLPERRALVERLERSGAHLIEALEDQLTRRAERLARCASTRVLREATWILEQRARGLAASASRLFLAAARRSERTAQSLERLRARLGPHDPRLRLERSAGRLRELARRSAAAIEKPLAARKGRLDLAGKSLVATSPFAVLARGYSITRRLGSSTPLTRARELGPGTELETLLAEGRLVSRVASSTTKCGEGAAGDSTGGELTDTGRTENEEAGGARGEPGEGEQA